MKTFLQHPAFLALAVLVVVCVIGVYVIRSAKSGISEGFQEKDEAQIYVRDKVIPTLEKIKTAFEIQKNEPGKNGMIDMISNFKQNMVDMDKESFRKIGGGITNEEMTTNLKRMMDFINKIIKDNNLESSIPLLPLFAYSAQAQEPQGPQGPQGEDKYQVFAREQLIPTYEKLAAKNYNIAGGKKLNTEVITPALFELRNVVPKDTWKQKPEAEKLAYINGEITKINSRINHFNPVGISKLVPMGSAPPAPSTTTTTTTTPTTTTPTTTPTPDTSSLAAAAMTGEHAVLNDTLQGILKRLNGLETTKTTPCKASLDIAQGANTVPCGDQMIVDKDAILAAYQKHQEVIKPHETPSNIIPSLTSKLATDKGTMAETIRAGEYLSPSVRQMIRDDVSKVVREEVEGSQYYNPHEVKYGY
jgi:hypothetical protein